MSRIADRRTERVAGPALLLLAVGACGGGGSAPVPTPRYQPTAAALLSTGSPAKDEDPSVLVARDGSIVVAWFSERAGDPGDIYIARCTRGTEWSSPVRVTTSPDGDFYPNLYQDAGGVFHLTWFRWYALNRGHIWYNRSTDPLVWDPGDEEQVTTTADVDDWVPSIAESPDSLRIFFASYVRDDPDSISDVYEVSKQTGAAAWGPAVRLPVNSLFEHDHLPFAAWTGGELTLVWVRHDTSQRAPWLTPPPTSQIRYAISADGTVWSPDLILTNDPAPVVNVFPQLYQRTGGGWRLLWLSTRTGAPRVFELPYTDFAFYPTGVVENASLPAGYSHRAARTPVAGLYFGAWVQGPEGAQDVYYRFYRN